MATTKIYALPPISQEFYCQRCLEGVRATLLLKFVWAPPKECTRCGNTVYTNDGAFVRQPGPLEELQIAYTATPRTPSYLADSMVSLFRNSEWRGRGSDTTIYIDGDAGNVAVSSPKSFLGEHIPWRVERAPFEDREWRIYWNTTRALAGADPARPLLLVQDDAQFADRWYQQLEAAVAHAATRYGASFALALWCGYPWEDHNGNGYVSYPPHKYYGNVAVLFMPAVLGALAEHLKANVEAPPTPDDMAVRNFFEHRPWLTLLATVPSLVQHIGVVSTHGDHGHLTSPTFKA